MFPSRPWGESGLTREENASVLGVVLTWPAGSGSTPLISAAPGGIVGAPCSGDVSTCPERPQLKTASSPLRWSLTIISDLLDQKASNSQADPLRMKASLLRL
jgi:hypothetical protein